MGIYSFYSNIAKKYPHIFKPFPLLQSSIKAFYLDSNSIVYDMVKRHEISALDENEKIINLVHKQIQSYIDLIKPTELVFISFDGVAPFAKLNQQRERRFKSWYQSKFNTAAAAETTDTEATVPFNTVAITPGSPFMRELDLTLTADKFTTLEGCSVIISSSAVAGEGEHKIFEHLRSQSIGSSSDVVIYGLDADLIVLSLQHIANTSSNVRNLYLFRETLEYLKNLAPDINPDENYLLSINDLCNSIEIEDNCNVRDFIFMTYFLGNDFMPHFPALNIRTGGIEKMLMAYNTLFPMEKTDVSVPVFVSDDATGTINYANLRKLLQYFASMEEGWIQHEYRIRNSRTKQLNAKLAANAISDPAEKLLLSPQYKRRVEWYINPLEAGWNIRYYEKLFGQRRSIGDICKAYFKNLQWNTTYYISGCPDWRWNYQYSYPPLFADLVNYIPTEPITFNTSASPLHPLAQLCYVLPKSALHLLSNQLRERLSDLWYSEKVYIEMAYCKYFWEAHIQLPHIPIDLLEQIVIDVIEGRTLSKSEAKADTRGEAKAEANQRPPKVGQRLHVERNSNFKVWQRGQTKPPKFNAKKHT